MSRNKQLPRKASLQQKQNGVKTEPLEEKKKVKERSNEKSSKSQKSDPQITKNATTKARRKSTIIAGQKIDLDSEQAQYLHLTLEQIQQLAMQQKSGEIFSHEKEIEHTEVSHCALHSTGEKKISRGKKTSIKKTSISKNEKLEIQKEDNIYGLNKANDILECPDVIKDAEASNTNKKEKEDQPLKSSGEKHDHKTQRKSSPVRKNPALGERRSGRSKSVVKQITSEASKKEAKQVFSKPGFKADGTPKGGLFAPTQSWLSRIGDKNDIKSRSPSPGPKEVSRRSFSVPRNIYNRSPSPNQRRNVSVKSKDPINSIANKNPISIMQTSSIKGTNRTHLDAEKTCLEKDSGSLNVNNTGKRTKFVPCDNNMKNMSSQNDEIKSLSNMTPNSKPTQINTRNIKATKTSKIISPRESIISSTVSAKETEHQNELNTMNNTGNSAQIESTPVNHPECKSDASQMALSSPSGVEETSISATEVIEMFETETNAFALNSETSEARTVDKGRMGNKQKITEELRNEEVVHKEEKSITATLNKATTSIKRSESFNNKIKSDNEKVSNIKEKTNEEKFNQSEKKMMNSEKKTNKAKATEKGSSSKSQESKLTVSSKKSATFVKDSTAESTKRNSTSKDITKTRTTMIIRLHPGQSKRLSAYLEQQLGDPADSLHCARDIPYEDTPGSICGLEISFSSVPQDIDIKLIPAGECCEDISQGGTAGASQEPCAS